MFFNNFPKIAYDIENNGVNSALVDIFNYVKIKREKLDKLVSYKKYNIVNGDRPDNVSYNLYGQEGYHWTFFLINDHLRDGISAWPKSYEMFNSWLEEQYGKYTVIEFLPDISVTTSAVIGGKVYYNLNQSDNYFGAIDFTNPYLTLESNTGGYAKCLNYDFNNLQLWNYDHEGEDKATYTAATSYKLRFDTTNASFDEYKSWLNSMIEYYEKSRQVDYQNFLLDIDTNEIIPYTQEYYDFFYNNYVNMLTFTPYSQYEVAYLAPKYYFNSLDETEIITHYEAINQGATSYKTYKEHEETVNDERASIKVLDPAIITGFSEAFFEKLNEQ